MQGDILDLFMAHKPCHLSPPWRLSFVPPPGDQGQKTLHLDLVFFSACVLGDFCGEHGQAAKKEGGKLLDSLWNRTEIDQLSNLVPRGLPLASFPGPACLPLAVWNLCRGPGLVHHVMSATVVFLRQQIAMFAVLPIYMHNGVSSWNKSSAYDRL